MLHTLLLTMLCSSQGCTPSLDFIFRLTMLSSSSRWCTSPHNAKHLFKMVHSFSNAVFTVLPLAIMDFFLKCTPRTMLYVLPSQRCTPLHNTLYFSFNVILNLMRLHFSTTRCVPAHNVLFLSVCCTFPQDTAHFPMALYCSPNCCTPPHDEALPLPRMPQCTPLHDAAHHTMQLSTLWCYTSKLTIL